MEKLENLSVVVCALNEGHRIARALESASFAGEIVVVDSKSSDNTVQIARQYTDRIYEREFDDFSSQKNYGIEQATRPWVFILDADEAITPELRNEIENAVRADDRTKAYDMRFSTVFMGRRLRYSGVQTTRAVRLFPADVRYKMLRVHEALELDGKTVIPLKNKFDHYTYDNLDNLLRKLDHYSSLRAKDLAARGYKVTYAKIAFKPLFRIFQAYILRGGFLDGRQGFIYSVMGGWEGFLRMVKTWRIQNGEKFSDRRRY